MANKILVDNFTTLHFMKKSVLSFAIYALLLTFVFSATPTLYADNDFASAQKRTLDRLEERENLWNRGLIGENNAGFVSARSSLNNKQREMVAEENKDRTIIYTAIAARTNSTAEEVGKQRAAQIAKAAKRGLWLQDMEGKWYRKS